MSGPRHGQIGPSAGLIKLEPLRGDWTRLNWRWSCRFSIEDGVLHCRWNRTKPPTLSQLFKMLPAYQRARADFCDLIKARLGVEIVCVEVAGEDGTLL